MLRTLLGIVLLCGIIAVSFAGIAAGNKAVGDDVPAMMVSPSVIVLAKVDAVMVHTNIVASAVEPGSVDLDGAAPIGVGVDSCGHIVLKFAVADLALSPGEATLTLSGDLTDGSSFSATDEVSVK